MDRQRDRLIRSLAEQYCDRHGIECSWYHGNWELLTSLGLVTTSVVHAGQLERLLAKGTAASTDRQRVLISGSTDDSLLKTISSAYRRIGTDAKFAAIDLCCTPLELMRLYADDNRLEFESERTDILDYETNTRFDVIVAHAFMGNFSERQRSELVHKWSSLLKPGGSVVTIQRVRPVDSSPIVRFTPEQSASFLEFALYSARDVEDFTESDLAAVERASRLFCQRFISHSICSKDALEGYFLNAGLRFKHLEYQKMETIHHLSGPSVPSGGEYALIVAGVD
jgi:hypothetical protein